jgi:diacylglycerol kinase (ATP)
MSIEPVAGEDVTMPGPEWRSIFVIINPASGRADLDRVREAFEHAEPHPEQSVVFHKLQPEDHLQQIIDTALSDGYGCIVAAGGDGTVSTVADVLIGRDVPLAILPIGTANVLARELEIPLDLVAAWRLILGPHDLRRLDAMDLGDRLAVLQIGIGLGSLMIRDTSTQAKKLIGRAAYIGTALLRLAGYEPRVFEIHVDGRKERRHALQIVVANGGVLGMPPFRWGPDIDPSDGRIDVAVFQARSLPDLLMLAWNVLLGRHRRNRRARYLHAHEEVVITTKKPLPVQADGEIIGNTPIRLRVRRAVLPVVVPGKA